MEHKTHQPSKGLTATKHVLVQLCLDNDHETFGQFSFLFELPLGWRLELHNDKELLHPNGWIGFLTKSSRSHKKRTVDGSRQKLEKLLDVLPKPVDNYKTNKNYKINNAI